VPWVPQARGATAAPVVGSRTAVWGAGGIGEPRQRGSVVVEERCGPHSVSRRWPGRACDDDRVWRRRVVLGHTVWCSIRGAASW